MAGTRMKTPPPLGVGMQISWNSPKTTAVENDVLVAQAKRAGLTWLAAKIGNNGESEIWQDRGYDLISRCRDAGIALYTWNFSYPGSWRMQVGAIAHAIELGSRGHIIDAEEAWEWVPGESRPPQFSATDQRPAAAMFMAALRARVGDVWLAHEPIWRPQSHPCFPWDEFGAQTDAVLPQYYWPSANQTALSFCQRGEDAWKMFAAVHPKSAPAIWPVGPTYGAGDGWDHFPGRLTEEDLEVFILRYADRPVLLFSWDAANAATWNLLNRWQDIRDKFPNTSANPFPGINVDTEADTDPPPPPDAA